VIRIHVIGNDSHGKNDLIHQLVSLISRSCNVGVVIENGTYSKYYGIEGAETIEFENLTFAKDFMAFEDSKDIYMTDYNIAQADVALVVVEANLLSLEFLKSRLENLSATRVVVVCIDMIDSVFDSDYWSDYYIEPLLKGKNVTLACIEFDESDQVKWLKQLLGGSLSTMSLSKHRQRALLDVYHKLLGDRQLASKKNLDVKEWRWRVC